MMLHTSPRSNSAAPPDGPPADWDEVRDRLQSPVEQDHGLGTLTGHRTLGGAAGTRNLRVTWRPADGLMSGTIPTLLESIAGLIVPASVREWWREHNPLVIQRLLVLVSVLLLVNLLANALT